MSATAWFCLGALSAFVYVAVVMWFANRVGRMSDAYDTAVPLTVDELNARRERLTETLIASGER